MYISVRRYQSEQMDKVIRLAQEEFVPIISQRSGFIAYYIIDQGDGGAATISIFENQADAEASNAMAAEWVKDSLTDLVSGPPDITAGEVKVHQAG